MTILRLYWLRELVVPFVMSIVLFTFFFMIGNLWDLADLLINKGVEFLDVFLLLLLMIPGLLGFILPTGTLASVLLVFGSFAQNNEITAVKASGIHLLRLFLPILIVAFLLSLLALFLVDQVQPWGEYQSRQLIRRMILKQPTAYLEPGRFIKDFKDYTFWINKINGKRLEGVTIFQSKEGEPVRTIMAEWGELVPADDDESFSVRLYHGTTDEPNPDDPTILYKLNFKSLLLTDIIIGRHSGGKDKKTKEMTIDELMYELKYKDEIYRYPKRVRGHLAEIHKKISFAFANFVFVMVGIPVAVLSRRGEIIVSFSFAGAFVGLYYILYVWGRTMALSGDLPVWLAMWFPNLLLLVIAVILTFRVIRT